MDPGKLVIGVVLPEEPEEVTNQLWSRTKVNIQITAMQYTHTYMQIKNITIQL